VQLQHHVFELLHLWAGGISERVHNPIKINKFTMKNKYKQARSMIPNEQNANSLHCTTGHLGSQRLHLQTAQQGVGLRLRKLPGSS
jgi:hypothetical protein